MQTKMFGWDDMNCFMLDVSMWSGRAKMSRDDLKDPDAVPPDALASLGTLKLIDPDRLKIFNAIKRRALRMLESHGVTFLNGFVVAEDKVDYIDDELVKLKDEYSTNVSKLVADYQSQCDDWLQKNAQWAHILRPRLPSDTDIMRKFGFDWTLFKVQPASSRSSHQGTAALEDAKAGLGSVAVVEVSKMLGECARNLLRDGRDTYNSNSFSAVDKAVNKCRELAFINPELGVLSSLIESVKSGVLNGSLSNDVFRVVFAALSSPASINNVLELSKAGVSVEDMGWALQPSVTQPTPPAPDEPVSCPVVQGIPQIEHGTLHIETETYDLGDIGVRTGLHVPPIPIPTVDSTQFAEPVVDTTPKEVINVPSDDEAEKLIEEATDFQNKIDGVNGEPWQVTVQDILKDLPKPAPIVTEPVVTERAEQVQEQPVQVEAGFTGLMNLDGII